MTIQTQHFPLSKAYLCENCQCVGNRSESCACCGSRSILSLGSILNRETVSEYDEERVLYGLEMNDPIWDTGKTRKN
jgi:hypothetical protein